MKLYVYGVSGMIWIKGVSPTGRILETTDLSQAYFFTEETKDEGLNYCAMGYELYELECTTPRKMSDKEILEGQEVKEEQYVQPVGVKRVTVKAEDVL